VKIELFLVNFLTSLVPNFQGEKVGKGQFLNKLIMKKTILFLLLISTVATLNAQSLKDALFSGKLKMDSNSVIRKGDDLSKKIDTGTKKAETAKAKITTAPGDSSMASVNTPADSATLDLDSTMDETTDATASETTTTTPAAPVKSNTKILKEYTDSLATVLKTEVLSSRKIKKETYYLLVEYEIGADGQTTILNVLSTPENELLQQQVKERMLMEPPKLAVAMDSNNQPRKVKRKYSFNVTKD